MVLFGNKRRVIVNIDLFAQNIYIDDSKVINYHATQKTIKRILDVLSSFFLLIITSPILLIACIAIRIESSGSPIYKQVRLGFNEKEFIAFKLRTMYDHSSDGNLKAPKKGDTRVTKVGSILRKTSIDEIPQLINVLLGDMSILGPRAVPKKELQLRSEKMLVNYPDKKEFFKRAMHVRMLVKPGISGMAQAYGRSSLSTEIATGYDVYYVLNYSIKLDIKIFFKTLMAILFQRGVN